MNPEGTQDRQRATRDWISTDFAIAGVLTKRTRNIVTPNGMTTETFRVDWGETGWSAAQVIHVTLDADRISAWHAHRHRIDGVFVVAGRALVALYDARPESATFGRSMALRVDARDPVLVVIPARVWHGIKPLGGSVSFLNVFNRPYEYEDPDEWRLGLDSPEIPFDIRAAT